MRKFLKICAFGTILSLLLLCSCATENSIRPKLPADALMNSSAGRNDNLCVNLHLENGKELLFVLDTGCPWTILDKSLEPELGRRTGIRWLHYGWLPNTFAKTYKSPKLYLGDTPLKLGGSIATDDMQRMSFGAGRPKCDGILGMDCLRNYCIQLDFTTNKIHFLNPDALQVEALGKPFPLKYIWWDLSTRMDIYSNAVWFGVDTGDCGDGTLKTVLLSRMKKDKVACKVTESKMESGATGRLFSFPQLTLGGETYTNLVIHKQSDGVNANILGLQFLARHLVTLNFPKQTMYLKQTSVGPLADEELRSAGDFIKEMGKHGQLPGASKGDKGSFYRGLNPGAETFIFHKIGEPSFLNYQLSKTTKAGLWKLNKAWRADKNGKVIEEYPVP